MFSCTSKLAYIIFIVRHVDPGDCVVVMCSLSDVNVVAMREAFLLGVRERRLVTVAWIGIGGD